MTLRAISWTLLAMVAASLMWSSAARTEEKKEEKVTKDQLAGEWLHTPGDRPAFKLKADGSGVIHGGSRGLGDWACRWDFNEHYQTLVFQTVQFRRQYKAQIEGGKVVLYDGREVYRKGVSLNAPLASPLDKALKAE